MVSPLGSSGLIALCRKVGLAGDNVSCTFVKEARSDRVVKMDVVRELLGDRGRMMKTFVAKPEKLDRKWYVIDGAGMPIGRLAVEVAKILRGKNKPEFTPNVDAGDFVIVVNAEKVVLTGKNKSGELLYRHSGYPGGIKSVSRGEMLAKQPVKLVMKAVKGMLPHNKLGDAMIGKLKIHVGPDHNHQAQMPEVLKFD